MKNSFAREVGGEVLDVWSIGDSFKALHVRTSESYVATRFGSAREWLLDLTLVTSYRAIQFARTHPSVELIEENQVRTLEACNTERSAIWVTHLPLPSEVKTRTDPPGRRTCKGSTRTPSRA